MKLALAQYLDECAHFFGSRQELNVRDWSKGDVRVQGFGERSGSEQKHPGALKLVDRSLEADELHHVVVERALINRQQSIPRPVRYIRGSQPVLEIVGGEWSQALSNGPVHVIFPGSSGDILRFRIERAQRPEGTEECRRHSARTLPRGVWR